jgi:hypothetical protein
MRGFFISRGTRSQEQKQFELAGCAPEDLPHLRANNNPPAYARAQPKPLPYFINSIWRARLMARLSRR